MTTSTQSRQQLADAFLSVPTGNISDAMDTLGLPRSIVVGLQPLSLTQPRTAGWAFTLKQMPRHQTSEGFHLTQHGEAINTLANPGDVIVIDAGGRLDVCTGGALLALIAKLRGLRGFVIDGCLRDIRQIIEMQFPAHCRGASPVRSSPDLETIGVSVPVVIGGVQVRQGDLIVADDSGVIVIAETNAADVLQAALRIQASEEQNERSIYDRFSTRRPVDARH